jgi:hypothetical protein
MILTSITHCFSTPKDFFKCSSHFSASIVAIKWADCSLFKFSLAITHCFSTPKAFFKFSSHFSASIIAIKWVDCSLLKFYLASTMTTFICSYLDVHSQLKEACYIGNPCYIGNHIAAQLKK